MEEVNDYGHPIIVGRGARKRVGGLVLNCIRSRARWEEGECGEMTKSVEPKKRK